MNMEHNKPIVSLKTALKPDAPSIDKYLTQTVMDSDYNGLLRYMADPNGDDNNLPLETRDEKKMASDVLKWLNSNNSARLHYIDSSNNVHNIALEDRVGDTIGRMLKRKTTQTNEGPLEYDTVDLIYRPEEMGGRK